MIRLTADADIVLVAPWDIVTARYLDRCPKIKYISLCGTSTANINLDELEKRDIAFSNVVSHGKEAVAEFVFMQLVRLTRGVGEYQWKEDQHQLMGLTLGIIGPGHVGEAVAQMALAYKLRTLYTGPHRKNNWEHQGIEYREKSQLLRESDVIVISSPTNVIVLDADDFRHTKPDAILVQTSSGTPFDTSAFFDWIARDNHYAIFDKSAGTENQRSYAGIARIVFSEKIAGDTYETDERRGKNVVENLKNYLTTINTA